MTAIIARPDAEQRLSILAGDSQYDLACACGMKNDDMRKRGADNRWIYPVTMADGRKTFLFRTMLSNACINGCRYCPSRAGRDFRRVSLSPQEAADLFFKYYRAKCVSGIFLTSGVCRSPDTTMERLISCARIIRGRGFKGYLHLKLIPGASDASVETAVSLASMVSINLETAGVDHFTRIAPGKDYLQDVIAPLKLAAGLTDRHTGRFPNVHMTTQFVVGAADERDSELIHYAWGLYRKLKLGRIYYSAYQRGLGDPALPGEHSRIPNADMLTREHRLYQVDWLFRKYGFTEKDIPVNNNGDLPLDVDPKLQWARLHPEFFPVKLNRAPRWKLLRVPGLGLVSAERILAVRRQGGRIRSLEAVGMKGKRKKDVEGWLVLD